MTSSNLEEAIRKIFPEGSELCVLHTVRDALNKAGKNDWEAKAYALFAFLRHPKSICRYVSTTNQLERVSKEVKRRTKVVEMFCGGEAVAKLLYLVSSDLNERLEGLRLWGFAEINMGSYHADQTH